MREITVNVTQEDICCGVCGASYSCPIAKAINRLGFKDVSVGDTAVEFAYNQIKVSLPTDAQIFVRQFDGLVKVQPFQFKLQVPWPKN